MNIKIYDNKLLSPDRYTVVIGKAVYCMNEMPNHPTYGVNSFVCMVDQAQLENNEFVGEKVKFRNLPLEVQTAICARSY